MIKSGLDALPAALVKGKRIGLVTNHTGIDRQFRPTMQVLETAGATVAALFGPEHGYYGVEQDAIEIGTATTQSGMPIYSLYRSDATDGQPYGPPPGSLDGLEALVFDIQDVGVRYYTYPSTLGILLEQTRLPVYVIDRPNSLGGLSWEGPFIAAGYESFVGRYGRLPVRHGLTMGELAGFINLYHLGGRADLQIVRMEGWRREMEWETTGLPWLATSPNLPTLTTARLYSGTCLLEGTNLSVGRGTTQPFELIGASWLSEPEKLAQELNRLARPGLHFRPTYFKPVSDLYAGEVCGGVQVHITNQNELKEVVRSGLYLVATVARLYPQHFEWRASHFDRLIGSPRSREIITQTGGDPAQLTALFEDWNNDEAKFGELRQAILLYK